MIGGVGLLPRQRKTAQGERASNGEDQSWRLHAETLSHQGKTVKD